MILVPDITRMFPVHEINNLDLSQDDLFTELLAIKQGNCPTWTDNSTNDFGIQILWLQATLSKWLVAQIERVTQNMYIGTTMSRDAMRSLCEVLDYNLVEATNSSVTVTFTLQGGHPGVTIPAKTKVATSAGPGQSSIIFETISETLVSAGVTTVNIACNEGETNYNEIIGSSDASSSQSYQLGRSPVVWYSETVQVHNGVSWEDWTRVENFVDSNSSDMHYRIATDESQIYYIIFGDGAKGRIPIRGTSNIRCTYRKGGGVYGNVGQGTITILSSAIADIVSVNNALPALGGTDRETMDHARIFAPNIKRTLERAVSPKDHVFLAESYVSTVHGGIAVAEAIEAGGSVINVMIVPKSGGLPSASFKNEVEGYLNELRTACTIVKVIDPIYETINYNVSVNIIKNYSPSKVAADIRARLNAYTSPNYLDPRTGLYLRRFGQGVYLSEVYSEIMSVDGVDNATVITPAANQSLPSNRIAQIGTITLSITSSNLETQYF